MKTMHPIVNFVSNACKVLRVPAPAIPANLQRLEVPYAKGVGPTKGLKSQARKMLVETKRELRAHEKSMLGLIPFCGIPAPLADAAESSAKDAMKLYFDLSAILDALDMGEKPGTLE